jgi:hypothetical protein
LLTVRTAGSDLAAGCEREWRRICVSHWHDIIDMKNSLTKIRYFARLNDKNIQDKKM